MGLDNMKEIKKIGMTLLVGLLLFGMVLSAGCVDEEGETTSVETDENEQPADTTETTSTESTESTEETSTSGTSLSDLLSKARDSSSVKYDMVMSGGPTGTITTKVWSTKEMTKTESTVMGQNVITIVDNEEMIMYTYYPSQNMAMKMNFSDSQTSSGTESFEDVYDNYNPTIVGTETIDGKMCTVIEYDADGAVSTKMWIWQEYGFPIKVESTQSIAGSPTTMVMEMKNIEFGSIPDSVFELPAGVEIQDSPQFF
ncbi:MAG: hypothetical protein SVK08_06440 [Halobacteriota archaeon]|nr:hypothetical protein [Halobacteriota archaeon]